MSLSVPAVNVVQSTFEYNECERSFLNWMRSTNNYFVADEYNLHLGIFLANSRFVKETNAKNFGFRVSMNKFACLTPAGSKTICGLKPHPVSSNKYVVPYQKSSNFVIL